MKQFTSRDRTRRYIQELKKATTDTLNTLANQRGDSILLIDSSQIYYPFVDCQYSFGNRHVARCYFIEGLEFLKQKPVTVIGDGDINYYARHLERDLKIKYEGNIPFPLQMEYNKVSTISGGYPDMRKSIIFSQADFEQHIAPRMHVDAYELRGSNVGKQLPGYIWLPHPTCLDLFKELLKKFVASQKKRNQLEMILDEHYAALSRENK